MFSFHDTAHLDEDEALLVAIARVNEHGHAVECVDGIGVASMPVQAGWTAVTVELWEMEPPVEHDASAETTVDVDLDIAEAFGLEELSASIQSAPVPPGKYRLRVSGFDLAASLLLEVDQRMRTQQAELGAVGRTKLIPADWVFRLWPRTIDGPDLRHRDYDVRG